MKQITVVGSFVTDMVATMPRFPQAGETVLGSTLRIYPGGKGINQCVAARRLGAEVSMVGMLGNDGNGNMFRVLMEKEGIDARYVFTAEQEPTAVAQVQIDGSSQNRICVIPSANYEFGKAELKKSEELIGNSAMVIAQLELRTEVVYALLELCEKKGVPVMLNPAPAQELSDAWLKKVAYLTPNETELAVLSGVATDTEEGVYAAAERLLEKGVGNVIATLGSRGALLYNKDRKEIVRGYRVKAVDTVAAGDSFNGALAKGIVDGKDLAEAIRYANAVGALTVTKQGAIPSLPTAQEVDEFLALQK